jgi:hypothetical protein
MCSTVQLSEKEMLASSRIQRWLCGWVAIDVEGCGKPTFCASDAMVGSREERESNNFEKHKE